VDSSHIEDILTPLNLHTLTKSKVRKLSGGEKRVLSLALALLINPKLLILDEPTASLDLISRQQVWQALRSLKGKVTLVLATQIVEEAEFLCDSVSILKEGRI